MENNNITNPQNKKSMNDMVKLLIGILVVIALLAGIKYLASALGLI